MRKIGAILCPATTPNIHLGKGNSCYASQNGPNILYVGLWPVFGLQLKCICPSMCPWLQIWMDTFLVLGLQSPSLIYSMRRVSILLTVPQGITTGWVFLQPLSPCLTLCATNTYGTRLGYSWVYSHVLFTKTLTVLFQKYEFSTCEFVAGSCDHDLCWQS